MQMLGLAIMSLQLKFWLDKQQDESFNGLPRGCSCLPV
jgi:hypothetical protein